MQSCLFCDNLLRGRQAQEAKSEVRGAAEKQQLPPMAKRLVRPPPPEGVAKVRPGLCETRKGKSEIFPFLAETTTYRRCFWQHILVLREAVAKLPRLRQPPPPAASGHGERPRLSPQFGNGVQLIHATSFRRRPVACPLADASLWPPPPCSPAPASPRASRASSGRSRD